MPNPAGALQGSLQGDLIVDSALQPGLKRAYGSESIGGDNPAMHQGVAVIPSPAGGFDTQAGADAAAAIAAVVGQVGYLAGFSISGGGATAGSLVKATIAGLAIGTIGIDIAVPTGADLAITPIFVLFPNPIPSSAVNTAITLSVPSFGAGNVDVSVAIWGYTSA